MRFMTLANDLMDKKSVPMNRFIQVFIALFMVFITVIGSLPMQVLANTRTDTSENLVGEVTQISSSEQGDVFISADVDGEMREFYLPNEHDGIMPTVAVGDTFTARARPGGMLPQFVGIGGTAANAMSTGLITTGM